MKIVFFDGYCSLCNASVDWLMKSDRSDVLRFASLQGETAKKLLAQESIDVDTVIYLRHDKRFDRSDAILYILTDLGGIWRLAHIFLFVPKLVRDFIYKIVARIRYSIFGKRETCRIPKPEEKVRLLP